MVEIVSCLPYFWIVPIKTVTMVTRGCVHEVWMRRDIVALGTSLGLEALLLGSPMSCLLTLLEQGILGGLIRGGIIINGHVWQDCAHKGECAQGMHQTGFPNSRLLQQLV